MIGLLMLGYYMLNRCYTARNYMINRFSNVRTSQGLTAMNIKVDFFLQYETV
jgi:hypothetical protein